MNALQELIFHRLLAAPDGLAPSQLETQTMIDGHQLEPALTELATRNFVTQDDGGVWHAVRYEPEAAA